MAAAEALTISRHIDDAVKDVGKTLEGVDETVKDVDHVVKGVGHIVNDVDRNVVSVIKGELCFHRRSPKPSSALYSVRCNGDRICNSPSVETS